jgi:ribosome-binding protein aMBF1 (putative translation factor)
VIAGALLIRVWPRRGAPANVVGVNGELQRVVGRNLRRIRTGRGVTQEELAEQIEKHRTWVGGIERGERNLSLRTIERLADALGVDAFALLARDD